MLGKIPSLSKVGIKDGSSNSENVDANLRFDAALDNLCQSSSWSRMLETIQRNTSKRLKENGYARYSELTPAEQAMFVEREFYEMQQANEPVLQSFGARLNKAVDDELLRLLYKSSAGEVSHVSNVEYLSGICSASIQAILKSSPPEFATAAKLFLNRSLPPSQRTHVWYASLDLPSVMLDTVSYGRLAPSLDVVLSRRCHEVLDAYFPDFSSRAVAASCKTAIANFMRAHNVQLPYTNSNFETTDRLLFVLVPAVHALQTSSDRGLALTYRPVEGQAPDARVIDRLLATIMGPRHLDQIKLKDSGSPAGLVMKSPTMAYTMSILDKIDIDFTHHLLELEPPNPFEEKRAVQLEKAKEATGGDDIEGTVDDGGDGVTETTEGGGKKKRNSPSTLDLLDVKSFRKWENFLNTMLLRGLSGLLNERTLLFVWDQCFITSFSRMLPVVLAALHMGAQEEIVRLKSLRSAIDSFMVYCGAVDEGQLQFLLTQHCKSELMDLFDIEGNYALGLNQDGVLQALYRKLMPVDDDDDFLAGDDMTQEIRRKQNLRKGARQARRTLREQGRLGSSLSAGFRDKKKKKKKKKKKQKNEDEDENEDEATKSNTIDEEDEDENDGDSSDTSSPTNSGSEMVLRPSQIMGMGGRMDSIVESGSQESLISEVTAISSATGATATADFVKPSAPATDKRRGTIAKFLSKLSPRRASESDDQYDDRMQTNAVKVAREGGLDAETPRTRKSITQYFNMSPRTMSIVRGMSFRGSGTSGSDSDSERPHKPTRPSFIGAVGAALSPRSLSMRVGKAGKTSVSDVSADGSVAPAPTTTKSSLPTTSETMTVGETETDADAGGQDIGAGAMEIENPPSLDKDGADEGDGSKPDGDGEGDDNGGGGGGGDGEGGGEKEVEENTDIAAGEVPDGGHGVIQAGLDLERQKEGLSSDKGSDKGSNKGSDSGDAVVDALAETEAPTGTPPADV